MSRVLHLTKYFYPVFGGVERIAEQVSEAIQLADKEEITFSYKSYKINRQEQKAFLKNEVNGKHEVVTPFFYWKSQPISFLIASFKLFRHYRKADVIIVHSPFPNFELAIMFFYLVIKKPIICVLHAEPADTRWKGIAKGLQLFYTRFLKICKVVVFTNEFNARKCAIPIKNSVIINNAVKLKRLTVKEFKVKPVYELLFVGSFREYKGLKYLIDVLSFRQDILINLVGSGEQLESIRKYVADNGYSSRVIFHGNISDEELEHIYDISDVFVLPSIDGSEAFGLVQVEAMSRGLPVINTNLETAVKFVSLHEVSGITVQPKNSQEIVVALDTILNKENYELYSANAVTRAQLFSSNYMVEKYKDLIGEFLTT